jgi:hypothetical protein
MGAAHHACIRRRGQAGARGGPESTCQRAGQWAEAGDWLLQGQDNCRYASCTARNFPCFACIAGHRALPARSRSQRGQALLDTQSRTHSRIHMRLTYACMYMHAFMHLCKYPRVYVYTHKHTYVQANCGTSCECCSSTDVAPNLLVAADLKLQMQNGPGAVRTERGRAGARRGRREGGVKE